MALFMRVLKKNRRILRLMRFALLALVHSIIKQARLL